MTFRRIAANTNPAATWSALKARALVLYKEWLREIPRAVIKYPLEVSIAEGRARVRHEFERYRTIPDLNVANVVLLKGTQELIETHNKWKQKTHVMRYFEGAWEHRLDGDNPLTSPPKPATIPNPSPFLSSFLKTRQ